MQADLELRDLPATASQVLWLKVYTSIPRFFYYMIMYQCQRVAPQVCKWLEEGRRFSDTGVTGSWKATQSECWKVKPGPLQEQQVLTDGPSLQHQEFYLNMQFRWVGHGSNNACNPYPKAVQTDRWSSIQGQSEVHTLSQNKNRIEQTNRKHSKLKT